MSSNYQKLVHRLEETSRLGGSMGILHGDQEVIMEIRYYVPNAPLMRSTKSYYVKEILRQFEEQDVKLAYPTRLIMKEDIE